jgi:serine/threonine protein kinase/tetratricopeptide (TPR) repeat protein
MSVNEESVFAEALEIQDPQERAAFLDRACAENPGLRRNVESLLSAYTAGQFLESPAPALAVTVVDPITECPGTIIGPYKLLEQIGEGGFGVVFMAEQQQPVRRKVALKVLKPGMDTRQVVARFEAERQALALMDHPHIAHVFDGGETPTGRPYFVMELVKGVPITEFCDQNRLTPRQRLELFLSVCQAVQHAHQKGIIHRDVKPSNVLVVSHDGTPVVKVIDFGVAKALGQELTDKTLFTGFAQMIGTPLYMSPEQAGQSGLDIDTRTDIYALGVLLYELLTGTTPFDKERLRTAGFDEMRRIIREEEPAKPSTRISTLGQAAATVSANRQSDPRRLSQLCRGELDWIVMKALEKDRNRRYESASALAADVQRYLHDEPVQACPPTVAYRLRKFVRRNKGVIAVGLAGISVVLLAIIGLAVNNWMVTHEKEEKETALARAVREKERADQNLDKAKQNLDKAKKAVRAYLEHTAGNPRLRVADLNDLRKDLLTSAIPFLEEFVRQEGKDRGLREEHAWAYYQLALVWGEVGKIEKALASYKQAQSLYAGLSADYPAEVVYKVQLAEGYNNQGVLLLAENRLDETEKALRRARDIRQKLVAAFPKNPAHLSSLGGTLHNLSNLERKRGNLDAVRRLLLQAIEHQQAAVEAAKNNKKPNATYREFLANAYGNLSVVLRDLGKWDEAEAAHQQVERVYKDLLATVGAPRHRASLAKTYNNLGNLKTSRGKYAEAAEAYREALKIAEKLAADFPSVPEYRQGLAGSYHNLAGVLWNLRTFPEAERAARQALDLRRQLANAFAIVPVYRRDLADSHDLLGLVLGEQKKWAEEEAEYRKALNLREQLGKAHPATAAAGRLGASYINVGVWHLSNRRYQAALEWLNKAVTTLEPEWAKHPRKVETRDRLRKAHGARAEVLIRIDRQAEALNDWERALELDDGKDRLYFRMQRALTLAHLKNHVSATAEANEVVESKKLPNYLRYDAACVFAVASTAVRDDPKLIEQYAVRAVELLRLAYQRGYKDEPDLRDDKNLDALRSRKDFQKLLAELEAKRNP